MSDNRESFGTFEWSYAQVVRRKTWKHTLSVYFSFCDVSNSAVLIRRRHSRQSGF